MVPRRSCGAGTGIERCCGGGGLTWELQGQARATLGPSSEMHQPPRPGLVQTSMSLPGTFSVVSLAQECLEKFTVSLSHKLDSHAVSGRRGPGGSRTGGAGLTKVLTPTCPFLPTGAPGCYPTHPAAANPDSGQGVRWEGKGPSFSETSHPSLSPRGLSQRRSDEGGCGSDLGPLAAGFPGSPSLHRLTDRAWVGLTRRFLSLGAGG